MRAAISSSVGFQSDMHLIVEQCVAQVRETAGLVSFDAEIVPLPLPKKGPPPLPKPLESSNALFGAASAIAWDDLAAALPAQTPGALAATVVAPAKQRMTARRWPVWVCAFVAGVSASAAFIASPVGHRPAVRHVVVAGQTQAAHVVGSLRSIR